MIELIVPKLPMRNKSVTREFYIHHLGFSDIGVEDYDGYLLLKKDQWEVHFFEYKELDPLNNYGQIYLRTSNIDQFYQALLGNNTPIHPNGALKEQPWGQKEFSILDPDNNLLTFGSYL